MAIDPSGRGTDETAVVVAKMLNGYVYVTEMKAYRDGYGDNTLRDIARLAKTQKVNHVIIEANFGDGMFSKLLQPWFLKEDYPCLIEEVKHSRQKEMRIIDTLEPVMNQHSQVVDRSVVERDYNSTKDLPPEQRLMYQRFYQTSRITRERGSLAHDDRLDCLAMAVGYWVEQMSQDAQKRAVQRREDLMKEELKAWEGEAKRRDVKLKVAMGSEGGSMGMFTFASFTRPGLDNYRVSSNRAGGLLSRFR
jgi:hypothetical protein